MTTTLNRYSAGSVDYVNKINSDHAAIEAALNNLEANVGAAGGGGTTNVLDEIWNTSAIIGASSYRHTLNSDTHLSFTSGSVWHYGSKTRGRQTSAQLLNFVGKASGTYFINADTAGNLTISTASAAVNIYKVYFSANSFGSAERLVPYLFDGADYSGVQSSVTFGSQATLTDRLSSIENTLTLDALYAQKTASGLTWDFKAGRVRANNVVTETASGTVTLSASQTHYIEVTTAGVISYATGGFTSGNVALRLISTDATTIVSNLDKRAWAIDAGSGAGGTGALTNSGTTDGKWGLYQNTGATSAPVSTATFEVDRGSQTTVALRWNETTDKWEFTNDGTSYVEMGSINSLNLGTGTYTRFTAIISQPVVLNLTGQNSTGAPPYAGLSISAHVSTSTKSIMLRGYAIDSNPATSITSSFGVRFFRDSATLTNDPAAMIYASPASLVINQMILVAVSDQQLVYELVTSSNASLDTKVALVGFFDEVTGVGTQLLSATIASNVQVSVGSNAFSLVFATFSAVANRAMIFFLETSCTIGAGSLYDVEIYGSNLTVTSQLEFQARGIDASAIYTTRLPWMYRDLASNKIVYLSVSNAGASAGLFTLKWTCEQYALWFMGFGYVFQELTKFLWF